MPVRNVNEQNGNHKDDTVHSHVGQGGLKHAADPLLNFGKEPIRRQDGDDKSRRRRNGDYRGSKDAETGKCQGAYPGSRCDRDGTQSGLFHGHL